jgi:hypothetical protein
MGSAGGWGGNPDSEAKYLNVNPSRNDGKTVYGLTVKGDVPVDGFWSITVYDAERRFQKNEYEAYSVNNLTGNKDAGGSIAVQFGGCDGKIPNCLPTMPGWNYMVLLYRPRAEILNGHANSAAAQPPELGHGRCSEHRVNAACSLGGLRWVNKLFKHRRPGSETRVAEARVDLPLDGAGERRGPGIVFELAIVIADNAENEALGNLTQSPTPNDRTCPAEPIDWACEANRCAIARLRVAACW